MKIKILLLLIAILASIQISAQLNMELVGSYEYSDCSDIWGYAAPDGTEYAIVGLSSGVSILNLADAENPEEVAFLPGANSGWRDIKTWDGFAYVINESANGLMVIDLRDLPNGASATDWTPFIEDAFGTLSSCHNIYIDEFGVAYLAGCNLNNGGLIFVDVASDPGNPIYLGLGAAVYSHDVYTRDNICYSSEISSGVFSIYDVTDKNNTVLLGSQPTPFRASHNAWLNDVGNVLFTTDETGDAPIGSYDVSDPNDIIELDQFRPYETIGTGVVPHNVHVWNDWIIISYYTDGCIVVDGSRPTNLVEVGNFDTFLGPGTGFSGAWGAYPYLPSGMVLTSNLDGTVNILTPTYVRAAWLEGGVIDLESGLAINNASIEILETNVNEKTNAAGAYVTGYAIAGSYEIRASAPGYLEQIKTIDLENEIVSELNFELQVLPSFSVSGNVVDAASNSGISMVQVSISNEEFQYETTTDENGNFEIPTFFEGSYEVVIGQWGYKTVVIENFDFDTMNNAISVELEEGIEDIFSIDLGWVSNGNSYTGDWELGEPIGTQPLGFYFTPPVDVEEDDGNSCYVTANTANLQGGVVIGGIVELVSPFFDVTNFEDPHVNFYSWWIAININTYGNGENVGEIYLSNGEEQVLVETLTYETLGEPGWEFSSIRVSDHLEPTASMKFTFRANSDDDFSNVAEAGLDFFSVSEGALTNVKDVNQEIDLTLLASPNPFAEEVQISYEFGSNLDSNVKFEVLNHLGQRVESKRISNSVGTFSFGKQMLPGVYYVIVRNDGAIVKVEKVVKQ